MYRMLPMVASASYTWYCMQRDGLQCMQEEEVYRMLCSCVGSLQEEEEVNRMLVLQGVCRRKMRRCIGCWLCMEYVGGGGGVKDVSCVGRRRRRCKVCQLGSEYVGGGGGGVQDASCVGSMQEEEEVYRRLVVQGVSRRRRRRCIG